MGAALDKILFRGSRVPAGSAGPAPPGDPAIAAGTGMTQ
jgi:hypothetical protein